MLLWLQDFGDEPVWRQLQYCLGLGDPGLTEQAAAGLAE
jgi:hypothetical protein